MCLFVFSSTKLFRSVNGGPKPFFTASTSAPYKREWPANLDLSMQQNSALVFSCSSGLGFDSGESVKLI